MITELNVGDATVIIHGSASLSSKIRKSIELRENMKPLVDELNLMSEVLPVPGAGDPILTLKTVRAEIVKLRQRIQMLNDDIAKMQDHPQEEEDIYQ